MADSKRFCGKKKKKKKFESHAVKGLVCTYLLMRISRAIPVLKFSGMCSTLKTVSRNVTFTLLRTVQNKIRKLLLSSRKKAVFTAQLVSSILTRFYCLCKLLQSFKRLEALSSVVREFLAQTFFGKLHTAGHKAGPAHGFSA